MKLQKKNMIDNLDSGKKVIKNKISLLPKNPGVYRMLSAKKEILYIGKAKNLKKRIKKAKKIFLM